MEQRSIWLNKDDRNNMPSVSENLSCDVLIIGGGIAGLSVAYHLMNSDKKVILVDKDICGMGATSKNTGKLTWMQDLIYGRLSSNYNDDIAKMYFDSQIDAINIILDIVKSNNIECDLTKTKSYVFSYNGNDYDKFSKEIDFYKRNNIKYRLIDKLPVKYLCKYALEGDNSYVFNPYKYLCGLKQVVKTKIDIYENSRCISINKVNDEYVSKFINNVEIKSKYVVVANHYPMFIVPFFIPFKTKVDKFFLGASLCDASLNVQAISSDKHSVSMRYYKKNDQNYLIYGRRAHGVVSNLDIRNDLYELKEEYRKYFGKELDYFYHTHDLMTYDGLPFIGSADKNLFICTGFNKWGNTNGTISGKIISDIIDDRKNKYISLFNPKRGLSLDKVKNLFLYNIQVGSRYVLNKINSNKNYYGDDVKISYINGIKCGIYIDGDNNKHIVSNICPHMKCNLIFNYIDKTWDCPCHASRFDIDGKVIYGPSVYDIKLNNDDIQ